MPYWALTSCVSPVNNDFRVKLIWWNCFQWAENKKLVLQEWQPSHSTITAHGWAWPLTTRCHQRRSRSQEENPTTSLEQAAEIQELPLALCRKPSSQADAEHLNVEVHTCCNHRARQHWASQLSLLNGTQILFRNFSEISRGIPEWSASQDGPVRSQIRCATRN